MCKRILIAVVVCIVGTCCGQMAYGQATGSFLGTVTDKSGSAVSGASVTVTSQGTGATREARSDDAGRYIVNLLPVSIYTIRVEFKGFQTVESKDVKLQLDERRELDFTLAPATVSASVEVVATEVAVETANPSLGQVITAQQVAQLPLNGRDFVQLATLTPGTTQETNPQSFFNAGPSSEVSARGTYSLSVGGSRAQSTDWLLDGVDNNELTAGGISILPSIDAIQEFKVLTYNYSAEYGTRAGPTVLVITKSGSNQFHGSVFEFFRNTKLDARSFFAPTTEQFNLNQFGGALGGPLQKDKTFFFLDYQAKRQRRGVTFLGLIPTPAMKNGDFTLDPYGVTRSATNPNKFFDIFNPYSGARFQCDASGKPLGANANGSQPAGTPCNKIPTPATVSPVVGFQLPLSNPAGQGAIDLYPTSNASNSSLGINFINEPVRRLNEGEFDVRLDHNFSRKDTAFARFSYDQANSFVPGGSPGFAEQGAFASTQNISNHARNVAVSETHIFSDRTINQISVGFNRIFNHILSFGTGSCESQKLGILGANYNSVCGSQPPGVKNQSTKDCVSCGLSSIQLLTGFWSLGDRGFAPFLGGTNVFSISDSFDMIRGKHDIRVGGQVRAQQMNVETNAFQDGFFLLGGNFGTFTGDTAGDLLLGQVSGAIHDQTFLGAATGRRWKLFRPYIQDDWRITSNLTANIGLAWALVTPITEQAGRQANFDFVTGKYSVTGPLSGCAGCIKTDGRVGIQLDKTALEPRIGLAWKPWGSKTTAVRAGYAIFHDSSWNQGGQGLWENPPYFAETDNFNFFPSNPCPFNQTTVNCGLARGLLPAITAPPNPATFTGTIQSQNLNFKQGRVQQFNLNIEHQLAGTVVMTVGYAGSRSHHILVDGLNENVGAPTACLGGANQVAGYTFGCGPGGRFFTPPYGTLGFCQCSFTTVSNINDIGNARYDSLQIKAETRSSRYGLYALFGYTYSRTFDSGFADGLGTTPGATYWPLPGFARADWSLSQINSNNQFTASVLYNLPFGKGKKFGSSWSGPLNTALGNWEIDVIERAISGFPLFVVNSLNSNFSGSGVNFSWNGNDLNRPNEVGDPNKAGPVAANPTCIAPTQVHTLSNWFNPCAFIAAPPGELGNAPRAPLYGPRFVNTDFSLIKHFPLPYREGLQLDFRTEIFNLFNHPQFFLPGSSLTGQQDLNAPSSLAKVTQTVNNPRLIQFALKLNF